MENNKIININTRMESVFYIIITVKQLYICQIYQASLRTPGTRNSVWYCQEGKSTVSENINLTLLSDDSKGNKGQNE